MSGAFLGTKDAKLRAAREIKRAALGHQRSLRDVAAEPERPGYVSARQAILSRSRRLLYMS
jgi:hypothetical protein